MFKAFSRLIKNKHEQNATTKVGKNQEEEKDMSKAKENAKTTNIKEEKVMQKATTKAKTTKKAAPAKAKEEMMTVNIEGIEITGTKEDVMAVIEAFTKAKESAREMATKGKTKGKGTKKNAPEKEVEQIEEVESAEKAEKTWTEKKSDWAKENYTDEERKEYGFKKSLERKANKFAFETTNASFKERVSKKEWNKAYKENLGYITNVLSDLFENGEAYTEEDIVVEFFKGIESVKKVRSDVKGFKKYVRA